jgi:membrane protein
MTDETSRPAGSPGGAPAKGETPKGQGGFIAAVQRRAEAIGKRIQAIPAVQRFQAIIQGADDAGGGLLAAGLAFSALFALLPALLALVGIAGFLIEDPERRAALITSLVARVPPLAGPISDSLEKLVSDRAPFSIIGIIGLVWGASNFYGGLDTAMARLFPGGRAHNFIEQRVRGVLALIGLVGAALGTVAVGSIWSIVEATLATGDELFLWRLVGPGLTIVVMIVATLATYRFVPTAPPGWRAALKPAVVAGLGIGLLTTAFTLIANRIVGVLAVFGVLAALFGALIWLSYVFQMLIWGAAWARVRRDQETMRRAAEPVPLRTPREAGDEDLTG